MSKFKYKLRLTGSKENKDVFCKHLKSLGYGLSGAFSADGTLGKHVSGETVVTNGLYGDFGAAVIVGTMCTPKEDFTFDLDDSGQYAAASFIAAIQGSDTESFPGELWDYKGNPCRYKVEEDEKITTINRNGTVDSRYFKASYGEVSKARSEDWHKMTPEEIINYFNVKNNKEMSTTKKLIGYKVRSTVGSVAKDTVLYINPSHPDDSNYPYSDQGFRNSINEITIGEMRKYPEYYEAVYGEDKPITKNITVGRRVITVSRGDSQLRTDNGYALNIDSARKITKLSRSQNIDSTDVCVTEFQIGCSDGVRATIDQIWEVINAWDEVNR